MMKIRTFVVSLFLFVAFILTGQNDYVNIQVKNNYSGGWGTQKTKLVELIPDFESLPDGGDDYTRYGTYKYLRTDSTGFFYTKKIDGRWWMVDPDGYAGINIAATSFTPAEIQDDYDVIRKNGYNGTGSFLSSESQTKSGYNMQNYSNFSFTRRLNFFLSYKNVRKNYYTTPANVAGSLNHIFVLDPEFEAYADRLAETNTAPFIDERDLLGWYTDNEINFNQDQLRNLVRDLPEGDPSRDAALAFAATKGLTEHDCINYTANVTEEIKKEFATYLAEHYYRVVSEAIRRYDPNHLILGSRLHGRPRGIQGVVDASHQYMDVTSVNFYDRFSPDEQIAKASWTADKPCIVGEFYVKDINVFSSPQPGAGWYVNSQADRGKFYQNTALELLENGCYIGWQYFRFQDDPDSNKGIVNGARKEYTEMTAYMNELNKQVYRLCDFYDGVNRRPDYSTLEKVIDVSEDTYVIPGSGNNSNFGDATDLEIKHDRLEANRREAFLKFDLSSVKSLLPYLKHAELEVTCTERDRTQHSIFVSGIEDTSWEENTFTGAIHTSKNDWKRGYNRLDFKKGSFPSGLNSFDVTTWVSDKSTSEVVSFKIHNLDNNSSIVKIASKENSDINVHPKLKLTFWNTDATNIIPNSSKAATYLYPNPASNAVKIQGDDIVFVELLTIDGKVILKSKQSSLDVSTYQKGVYLVRTTLASGKVEVHKLVRE